MKRIPLLVMMGILIFGLVGVLSVSSVAKDTIVVAVGAPPQTMNPHGSDSDCNLGVVANIFEGLL